MKKAIGVVMVLSFFVALTVPAAAADKKKSKEVVVPALTEQQRVAIETKAVEQLNAQTWTIYLIAQGVKKQRVETDVLTFTGGVVVSSNLSAKGYIGSNFTLTAQEDGNAVFETVQRREDGGLALWRGTLSGNRLTGIVNIRPTEGQAVIYSFTNMEPSQVVAEPEPEAQEPQQKKKR